MSNGTPTAASTTNYTGVPAPDPTQAGITSTAGWASNPQPPNYYNVPNEVLEGVAAPVKVVIGGTGVTRIAGGSPQQSKVTLSLSGTSTVQLTPTMSNAQNAAVLAVSPNVFNDFLYTSRNINVVTVSPTGLVTAVGRGEASVLVGISRHANLPLSPTAPEVYAELIVTVIA